jgi:serine/threonine-protein kinase RsbW
MTEPIRHTMRMATPPGDVNTVHEMLEQVWTDVPEIGPEDRLKFEIALIELASNVMRHADAGTGVVCALVIQTHPDRITATLSDSGEPGNVTLAGRSLPEDALAESGRGIPLIQALVDELRYDSDDGFNHWHISRTLES